MQMLRQLALAVAENRYMAWEFTASFGHVRIAMPMSMPDAAACRREILAVCNR